MTFMMILLSEGTRGLVIAMKKMNTFVIAHVIKYLNHP